MDSLAHMVQAATLCQLLYYESVLHENPLPGLETALRATNSAGSSRHALQNKMHAFDGAGKILGSSSQTKIHTIEDWITLSEKLTGQLATEVLGSGPTQLNGTATGNQDKTSVALETRIQKCQSTIDVCLERLSRSVVKQLLNIGNDREIDSRLISELCTAATELTAALECSLPSDKMINILQEIASKIEEALSAAKFNLIIGRLKFQTLSERFESITKAEESTFCWLLGDNGDEDSTNGEAVHLLAKERLVKWMKEEEGFFYVSGKPGAGKSTLMKLICNHPSFAQFAGEWAGDSRLITGRFFFWKPGHSEQKSIEGLLRGLLYSMLEHEPRMTKVAFPALWQDLSPDHISAVVLEHPDVEAAFHNILRNALHTGTYKIILMIDGLDEFDGDHAVLLSLMRSWVSAYPSIIKICVSSREYGIFEDFFLNSPKMRLHELTRGDMAGLISFRLKSNKRFSAMALEDRQSIMTLITDRAEGVFLWVVMVVAAMDNVLLSGSVTNARELKRSIEDCPTELDHLLPHLLSSVAVHSRPWAYKAISLVKYAQFKVPELLQSKDTAPGVGLLDLMLLDEASPSWNLSTFQPRSETKSTDLAARLQAARKKILGQCKGFLNVITIAEASSWPANGDERTYVAVTHRSVVEFLDSDKAEGIMGLYLTQFDPFFALFSTMLACLRFLEPSNYPLLRAATGLARTDDLGLGDVLASSLQKRWREFIQCAFLTGHSSSPRFFSIIDAVGDAVKRHLVLQLAIRQVRLSPIKASPHQLLSILTLESRISEYSTWRRGPGVGENVRGPMNVGLFQAFHRTIRYFQLNDYEYPAPGQKRDADSLVNTPIDWIKWSGSNKTPTVSGESFMRLLTEFFERGVDLNWTSPCAFSQNTDGFQNLKGEPWTCWQALLWSMLLGEIPSADKYPQFVDAMIRHGADSSIEIFSVAPLENIRMDRLRPQEGWTLFMPFSDNSFPDHMLELETTPTLAVEARYSRIPVLLIRESAPIFCLAKEKNWRLTVRDLVPIWFPNSEDHFNRLFDGADHKVVADQCEMPLAPSDSITTDTTILGSRRGSCDLAIYLEEKRVAMGLSDEAATIRRKVKVG